MTRFHKLLLPLAAVFLLAWAGLVVAQNSAGGSFAPAANYTVSGAWTWRAQTTPFLFRGTQTLFGTSFVVATPTANRTWTLPDTNGTTFVGTTATQTLTNKTLTTPTITTPTITAPVMTTITNTGTLTLPSATGGVPVALNCGATGSGNQTCSATAATALTKVYGGSSTMSSNAAVITFPVAFAATTSYQCVANDITTRANPVQMISTSTTTATITNTTGASDVINWVCVGQ